MMSVCLSVCMHVCMCMHACNSLLVMGSVLRVKGLSPKTAYLIQQMDLDLRAKYFEMFWCVTAASWVK